MTQRQRSSGKSKQFVWRSTMAQLHTSCGVRAARQRLVEVAGVVDVVVGQEDPPHVLRLDQREHVLQPLLTVRGGAGVDDHRLLAEDHHRVEVDEQRLAQRRLHLMDDVGVLRDQRRWTQVALGAMACEDAHVAPPLVEPGAREGTRTPDLCITSESLCQPELPGRDR